MRRVMATLFAALLMPGQSFAACVPDLAGMSAAPVTAEVRAATVEAIWRSERESYRLPTDRPVSIEWLYGFEVHMHDGLNFVLEAGLDGTADEILAAAITYRQLYSDTDRVGIYYLGNGQRITSVTLPETQPVLLAADGTEARLHTSQYLASMAEAVRLIAARPASQRTPVMQEFLSVYVPLAMQTLERWGAGRPGSFQNRAWGCRLSALSAVEFMQARARGKDPAKASYCNAMTDVDVWITFGALQMLAAARNDPGLIPARFRTALPVLQQIVAAGALFIERSLHPTVLRDAAGREVGGVVIDPGVWSADPTFIHAGDEREGMPTALSFAPSDRVSWDVSHAARLPRVLVAFAELADDGDLRDRFRGLAASLGNQVAYAVTDEVSGRPRFRNYLSGENGWFRVRYLAQAGYGIQPWAASADMLRSPYFTLAAYNPELVRTAAALFRLLVSQDAEDCAFVDRYFVSSHFSGGQPAKGRLRQDGGAAEALSFIATMPLGAP